ncbi:MAG: penicillin-binding protein 2 [Bacteroidales bacterium]|nr:penicillin-binding protein 2 [Bacteroidales bacterium]
MDQYSARRYIVTALVLLVVLVYLIRLLYLQVIDSTYKLSAENNSKRIEILYPSRGLMYDRKGQLLVYNQAAYDLMIAPYELKEFDTIELCQILNIDKESLITGIKKAYNPKHRRDPFLKQISPETFALLKEKLYKYSGFYLRSRTLRKYNREIGSHLLGYVGEVSEEMIGNNPYYEMGDYIGISGLEKAYETQLRGEKGMNYFLVDVHNKIKGPYQNGRFDKDAVVGKNVVCTIDADLQEYGEKLMKNYSGSIVAIEPSTGEILTLISTPSYNPSLLVGRPRTLNYNKLKNDTLEPLFNRAIMARYPPGSIFKLVNALVALQEKDVTYNTQYYCDMGYYARGIKVACHNHDSPLNLPQAIQHSCNAYFCNVFRSIMEDRDFKSVAEAFNNWRDHVLTFGFGNRLNTDLPNELNGFIPQASYYDRYYGQNHWNALTILSMAIGQGELLITPVQMANMACVMANRGYYYIPHTVKQIQELDTIDSKFLEKHFTSIDTGFFNTVIEGMELAVNGGAGSTARIARISDIIVCGKTGTAENPHGEDHSVFIAFAPKDNPKIALSVYVEHGKWGASYAAPIASLMIEKYLTGEISNSRKWIENRMLNDNLLNKK